MLAQVDTQELVFTYTFSVAAASVYRAFTNATALREWMCDRALVNAREGETFFLTWNGGFYAVGTFTALVPHERIAYIWQGKNEPGPSEVEIRLEPVAAGTRFTLKHGGFGGGEIWTKAAETFRANWESGLENLQSVLETGLDLRLMRRPMLGIYLQPLTPEIAAKVGAPVTTGTHLEGVVEGLGAQAAGLQKDDVIVSLAGKPVVDYVSMTQALTSFCAGDTVEVVYYRGSECKTTQMTLSGRPKPDVPESPSALAQRMQTMYAELDGELDSLLTGVTDAEASQPPAPNEWNVKQILAHLIWTERYNQLWIWSAVGGDDNVPWPDNNPTHLAGILADHATLTELVAELKCAEQATAATAAAMPETYVNHKASYLRHGQALLSLANHTREHFNQMREALAAARKG